MLRANPRAACVEALTQWEHGHEFADKILHRTLTAARFSTLDRALFTEIFYGVIRYKRLLDFLTAQLRKGEIDDTTRQVLRLGLYQIFRTRIPHHAVVNETVELAGRARKLVNAVLRRCIREEAALRRTLESAPLGVRFSHPEMLVERWRQDFGEENTHRLCEWNNAPAEVFIRANLLKVTRDELLRTSVDAELLETHPLMLRVKQIPLMWIVHGLCYVQDPSTLVPCELLNPQPGERVLDACAAPGGKTSYLAQMMQNAGQIFACDASEKRLTRLQENLTRLGVANTEWLKMDWLNDPPPFPKEDFDAILVDAPCSNTGVMRRRVDVRWRLEREEFSRMQETQLAMLRKIAPLLKRGGRLVYSTCSIEPEENEQLVERAAKEIPELQFIESRQVLPFRDGVDGAFAARFERS
jgi:16S rRNA (cytosine967-C5)-methyltransferase